MVRWIAPAAQFAQQAVEFGEHRHPLIVTTPPSTVMRCSLRMRSVATPVPSTAGMWYSRATMEL